MAFTKVTNTGIGSTGTVLLQNLNVTGIVTAGFGVSTVDVFTTGITSFANTTDSTSSTTGSVIVSGGVGIAGSLNVGGSVSVGGTLTYEDVTNVDSVGIITARSNILVGSGITLSPGGDSFATGVTTAGSLEVSTGFLKIPDSIIHVDDPDTKIRFPSDNNISFETNGSERVRITGIGSVGIGAVSPSAKLVVSGNSSSLTGQFLQGADTVTERTIFAQSTNGNNFGAFVDGSNVRHLVSGTNDILTSESNYVALHTNSGTERLRIDSSGRVLIGHDTPSADLHGPQTTTGRSPFIQLHGANTASAGAALISWKNQAGSYYAPTLYLAHSGSDTIGTNGVLPTNGEFGSIVFSGDDGTDFVKGAMIKSMLDGTPGDNDMPGRLQFYTTPDGAQSPEERLRITSGGQLLVNTTSYNTFVDGAGYSQTPLLQVVSDDNTSTMISLKYNSGAGAANRRATFAFARTADGTAVSDDSVLGEVLFMGEGNSAMLKGASVRAEVDGAPGASDMPGRLVFSTTADGSHVLTERFRITSDGKFGFGTNSPNSRFNIKAGGGENIIELQRDSTNTTGNTGCINFTASDGHSIANIGAYGGGDNESGYINFKTTTSASANSPFTSTTERMRIHANGDISVGTTSGIGRFLIKSAGNGSGNSALRVENSDGTYLFIVRNDGLFQTGNDGNSPYNITGSTGANVFIHASSKSLRRSTSSIRYKKDITDATWGLAEVLKLRPVTFKSNGTGDMADDQTYGGFTAEDIHDLGLTEFVQYNENNEPDALSYGHMVALLTNAIKELNAKIVALGG